jgi:hypothetical protein
VKQLRIRAGHLIVLAAAAFLLADLAIVWIGWQGDFAFDFTCCYKQAATRALGDPSTLYAWSDTYTFRYTPLGALFFVPLIPFSEAVAPWVWLAFKIAVLVVAATWFSRPWSGNSRWLVAMGVAAFPPVVHDLVIGNVSTLTLLVFIAIARWQDVRGGVAIGLLTLLMPKPHLIPVLVYLSVRRPRDFMASMATMAVGALLGFAIFGIEPWLAFVGSLREPLERTFTANVGFSGLFGPLGVIIGFVIALVVLIAGVLVGGARGYGLSIISGIVMGPYTFIHYLSGTIVAVEPTLRASPRRLAVFPWLLVSFPLIPVWLTGLALVVRSTPPDDLRQEGVPRGAAPG